MVDKEAKSGLSLLIKAIILITKNDLMKNKATDRFQFIGKLFETGNQNQHHINKKVDAMKITMLGTAAIGYPFAFCNCENCTQARIHRGKSIRKRASMLINDDLLIDLGPDVQTAMTMYGKNMGKIKFLLQTHVHIDHFDEGLMISRIPYMAMQGHNRLEIFAHPTCLEIMSARVSQYENADLLSEKGQEKLKLHTTPLLAGNTVTFGNYKVKAIETTHDTIAGSLLFAIEENGKQILYATDTPALTEQALEQLSDWKLDMVIMDHTFGNVDYSFSHLNENLFLEQIHRLKSRGTIDDNTLIYGTHISHDGMPYHEISEQRAALHGYHIAYDGMEIQL